MLSFISVCAIGLPLMVWALSPNRRPRLPDGYHSTSNLAGMPGAGIGGFNGFDTGPS